MSSPFAQKFMDKKPFSDEYYEALVKKYTKKEKKQSAETPDATDYETKIKFQEELAEELANKKKADNNSPLNGAYESGAGSIADKWNVEIPIVSQAFSKLQGQIMQGVEDWENKKARKNSKCPPGAVSYMGADGKMYPCNGGGGGKTPKQNNSSTSSAYNFDSSTGKFEIPSTEELASRANKMF